MKKEKKHVITRVLQGSIAEELQLCKGDKILSINGKEIEDVFDYRFLMNDENILLLVEKEDGELWELEIEKEAWEDIGAEFENGLMDEYRSCSNKCIFCFIDQMPPGMRRTLYFKDDDSRLSFLQGNYVTLTNMSEKDIRRIIEYHLEPINISFQTMEPELRCKMLHNRFAGEALKKADLLYQAGITMNGQIVLCKGVNDGEHLRYSLEKLYAYVPVLQSVSVVPVGLTRYREGLYPLEPFSREDAKQVLDLIRDWQKKSFAKTGMHFVHASDEWYLLAEEELPEEESYDGYLQLENGVGMLRLLREETKAFLSGLKGDRREKEVFLATGLLPAGEMKNLAAMIRQKFPNVKAEVVPVINHFFGEQITVSGLITGQDLAKQLRDLEGKRILIPCNMLRDGENVFLDDMTVEELSKQLKARIEIVERSGEDLVRSILELSAGKKRKKRRQMYEQTGGSNRGETECREVDPF